MKKYCLLAVLILFLSGCSVSSGTPVAPAQPGLSSAGKPVITLQPEEPAGSAPAGTEIIASLPTPNESAGSPTPDLRLKPEQWMEWPVVPTLSPTMRAVYLKGQKLGNLPNAFSKVGDCQNICEAFLCLYDQPGAYKLTNSFALNYPQTDFHTGGNDFSYLQETIDAFAGSWGREGTAVQGGFNFPAVYSPLRADPAQCKSGETPLVCEVRLHKPSFLVIGMEYWYKGRTAENFENYLRKTVAYALDHGIVPIVEAKADNMEGDHGINLATARVAYEYDLPFWNFWRAVQALPDHGMDTRRDHADGFHISYDAQLMRSFSALQVLDSLRRSIDAPAVAAAAATETSAVPLSKPTAPVSLDLKGSCPKDGSAVLFNILRSDVNGVKPAGIQLVDPAAKTWTTVSERPYALLGVSPQGCRILLADGQNLYASGLDGSQQILLNDRYAQTSEGGALWLPARDEIAYIAAGEDGLPALFLVKADGSGLTSLPTEPYQPLRLYPSPDGKHLYWESGKCPPADGDCTPAGARVTALAAKDYPSAALPEGVVPNGSPQAGLYAFTGANKHGEARLMIGSLDGGDARTLEVSATQHANEFRPPTHLLQYAWSPDGKHLSVIGTDRSTYSGKQMVDRYFVISADNVGNFILPEKMGRGLMSSAWTPDGKSVLFAGTEATPNGVRLLLKSYALDAHRATSLESPNVWEAPADTFLYIADLFWFTPASGTATP